MGGDPLPANGLLHVLRFSTISSRLPPPREEPGPCPGSLRFHAALSRSQKNGGPAASRSGSLPSRRKRKYGKRPCIRGTLPTAPASPLRHHIADFGDVVDEWLNFGYCRVTDHVSNDIALTPEGDEYFGHRTIDE